MSFLSGLGSGLKRMTSMVFRRTSYRIFQMPGSNVDYLSKVGDGTGSSTVAAPLMWIARTFPEAPPSLWQEMENGQEEQVRQHDMLRLLARPNAYYTGPILWMATTMDWNVDGNAYWLKLRDQDGIVRQLWWVPHWMIEPKGDESTFIDHYEYTPGTEKLRIEKEDVVHFRNGLDSEDSKLGSSPLKSVLREVFTDDEAAAFTASLLGNMGVPGLVVAPGPGVTIDPQTALDVKKDVSEKFSGDRRGEAIVMTGPTEIHQFGFSPEQLVLKDLRRIPEERVTAVLGVPAIVAGLGAGLDRSTFTNMGEARAAAYESGLIPMQRILAEDIRFQLLNEFEEDPFLWRFGFDLTKVRVLQEDLYRQAQRHDLAFRGGWEMRSEARRAMGLEVDSSRDDVFYKPVNVEFVDENTAQPALAMSNGSAASLMAVDVENALDAVLTRRELTTA
jgi:HK97 family phage portal protein